MQLQDGSMPKTIKGHTEKIWTVAFNNDNLLASGSSDKSIRIWDVNTGNCLTILKGHLSYVRSVVFNKVGLLASGSEDKSIKTWDAISGKWQISDPEGSSFVLC
jgi:WD40 repeat protein